MKMAYEFADGPSCYAATCYTSVLDDRAELGPWRCPANGAGPLARSRLVLPKAANGARSEIQKVKAVVADSPGDKAGLAIEEPAKGDSSEQEFARFQQNSRSIRIKYLATALALRLRAEYGCRDVHLRD